MNPSCSHKEFLVDQLKVVSRQLKLLCGRPFVGDAVEDELNVVFVKPTEGDLHFPYLSNAVCQQDRVRPKG